MRAINVSWRVMKSNPVVMAVLFTIMAIAIVLLIIVPSWREINWVNLNIKKQREALDQLYAQGQNFRLAAKEYDQIKPDVPLLDGVYFILGEELRAITRFESIADEVGVAQVITLDTNSDTLPKGATHPYRRIVLRLEIMGTYRQLVQVLQRLEHMPEYVNVLSIGMSEGGRSYSSARIDPAASAAGIPDEGRMLTAIIQAATYWKKSP